MRKINVLSLLDGKYEVHSDGKIYSNARKTKVELVGKITKHGYRLILLTVNHKRLYRFAHRIVAEAFIPNPHDYKEVNHIDGNKLNNSVENVEWCNSSQNQKHCRDFLNPRQNKIDMGIANQIRNEKGLSYKELGEKYGLKKTQIGYILQNKRWVK